MKLLYTFITFAIVSTAYAETPYDVFSATANRNTNVTVTWQYSDDIQTACNKQRTENGEPPYPFDVQACSVWYENNGKTTCTIITKKNLTMWSLGHEIRHCFQGAFHK